MRYDSNSIPVCTECSGEKMEQDLSELGEPEISIIKSCRRCGVHFCKHFASSTDVRYCGNCLSDFKVTITTLEKIEEKVDEDTGQILARKRQVCKSLKLTGTDWLFESHKISTMNDEELLAAVEYHDVIKGLLLHERETRRIEKFKKMASIKLPSSAKTIDASLNKGTGEKTAKQKQKKEKAKADPLATLKSLGINIDPAILAAALKKG